MFSNSKKIEGLTSNSYVERKGPKISFKNEQGVSVSFDIDRLQIDKAERAALNNLLTTSNFEELESSDKDIISNLKVHLQPDALIVRFDATWVRIDEAHQPVDKVSDTFNHS